MEKLKQHSIIGIALTFIFAFSLYWFIFRTEKMRVYCYNQADAISPIISDLRNFSRRDMFQRLDSTPLLNIDYQAWKFAYDICLAEYPKNNFKN